MSDLFDGVPASFVENGLWTVAVAAVGYLSYRALATRRAARIWGLPALVPFLGIRRRSAPTIVVATSGVVGGRAMTGVGQVRAIAIVAPTIQQAYGAHSAPDDVRMSSECQLQDACFEHDLVTVGGPKTNQVTRAVLERLTLPDGCRLVSEEGVDRIYWDGADGRARLPNTSDERRYALGLVIRCENPIRERGVVTVLAGAAGSASGTYGTEAAASALVLDADLLPSRWRALRGRRVGYVALVAAEIVGDGEVARLLDAEVLDVHELPWRAGSR